MYVIVVNGTAYEMGYAYGELMKEEIPPMIDAFFDWAAYFIENNVSDIIKKMPKFYKEWIGKTAVKAAQVLLNLNWYITKPYTPARFDEEILGLSEATGISEWLFR